IPPNGNISLIFRERNTGNWINNPVDLIKVSNNIFFHWKLDYFYIKNSTEYLTSKWDAYFQIDEDGSSNRYRIKLEDKNIEHLTKVQFEESDIFQMYFYKTKFNNLS